MSRRALLVTPVAAPGGAERALAALATHLPAHGWAPEVASLQDGPAIEWFRAAGVPVHVVRHARLRHVLDGARAVARLRALLRDGGFHVVVGSQAKGHLDAGVAARLAAMPAVWWNHVVPERDWLNRLAARVPARAVVCSTRSAAEAMQQLAPHTAVRVVPPGVAIEQVAARRGEGAAVRTALGWDGHPVVGIVGRLQPWKGQRVFLDAAAAVAARLPEARFAVVGGAVLGSEGAYPDELRRHAHALGLTERVHFAGHQPDPYPWLDALDVVVLASVLPEPFGLVVVEAMALGKPVVATAAGGPLDIVEPEVSGLLVAPGDAHDLAVAVERLLRDAPLAARLGAAAARRAGAFTAERMAAAFARVLDGVVEHAPPP